MSVRTRLILGATVFAAVAIFVALVAGRVIIAAEFAQTNQQLVMSDLDDYVAEVVEHSQDAGDGDRPLPPPSGALIAVRTADGDLAVDTLPESVSEALDDHPIGSTFDVADDGRTWLVASSKAADATVWAARDISGSTAALATIDTLFLAGGALLVGLFAVASTFFVRAALRPIEVMRARERRMVSDAAHELRTPLAGLRGQLEVIGAHLDDPEIAGAQTRQAERSVDRLSDLASNLLELARLEERTATPTASVSELREMFLSVVDDARLGTDAREVSIEQVSEGDASPGRVRMDAVSFGRIVQNLLSNAVRAAGPGGTVTAALVTSPRGLVLTVDDDGPGMTEEFRARALERFTRDGAPGEGSGLGLALVDGLARAAGGSVTLENTAAGFRVAVRVPVDAASERNT